MLLYNTHGWIHLSIGRPDRWFRWGVIEFLCTVGLFVIASLGTRGIALAWTISYFILMLPAFWYAGKPIGFGVAPVLAVVWKFFVAAVVGRLQRRMACSHPARRLRPRLAHLALSPGLSRFRCSF